VLIVGVAGGGLPPDPVVLEEEQPTKAVTKKIHARNLIIGSTKPDLIFSSLNLRTSFKMLDHLSHRPTTLLRDEPNTLLELIMPLAMLSLPRAW
jgi:hypothetical protein